MGETIEVTPERVDANYVASETIIPAGRVVVKSTSSVLFENSMWPYFKVSDSSGVTIGKGNLDCRHSYKFNSPSEMIIAFTNLLGEGYTYEVSLKNAEDEEGEYTEVTVNVSKDIENYAILRVSTEIDEKLVSAHGTLVSLQINGDGDILLLPFWSTETYDLYVAPGDYRRCGYWDRLTDPDTGKEYAPYVDTYFVCTSGEITEITLYLKELD